MAVKLIDGKTKYVCTFEFSEKFPRVISHDLSDFLRGFWLDDLLRLTKASDCKYWIPPSKIQFIEKRSPATPTKEE